jgi:hypothetical protein
LSVVHTLRHLLTPGTPVYGLLKLASVGLLFGLYATRGRSAGRTDPEPAAEDAPPARPQRPHPRSRKKRRRRR